MKYIAETFENLMALVGMILTLLMLLILTPLGWIVLLIIFLYLEK